MKDILICAAICAAFYIAGAFAYASFNITDWDGVARGVIAGSSLYFSGCWLIFSKHWG